MKYIGTLIAVKDIDGHIIEAAEKLDTVIARFVAQGLSPEETADRMDIPA